MHFHKCILYLTMLAIAGLHIACKKSNWYDVRPTNNLVIPGTLKDLQAILDNAELFNRNSPSLGEVASDGHYISDDNYRRLPGMDKNAYTWSHNVPYMQLIEWSTGSASAGAYSRIYQCNLVLEYLDKIRPSIEGEEELWKDIKGQALFHRGRTFYELSQVFAPPYNSLTAGSDLGIPLRMESDITISSRRFTVKETFDQIFKDIQEAADLLSTNRRPNSSLNKTRPTRAAAFGYLARAYLSIEDYAKAADFVNKSLNIYDSLIDYHNWNPVPSNRPFFIFHPEVIWHSTISEQFRPLFATRLLVDTSLYNLYNANDKRKELFFLKNSSGLISFKGQYSGSASQFAGLAVDEMYLIRAECLARQGNVEEAMKDINKLLRSRWKKDSIGISLYNNISITDPELALRIILEERKKELFVRGTRWSDLRRLNKDTRFQVQISRSTPEGKFQLDPNSYKYTFPIPDDIIAITGMPQNEGW